MIKWQNVADKSIENLFSDCTIDIFLINNVFDPIWNLQSNKHYRYIRENSCHLMFIFECDLCSIVTTKMSYCLTLFRIIDMLCNALTSTKTWTKTFFKIILLFVVNFSSTNYYNRWNFYGNSKPFFKQYWQWLH